MYVPNFEAIQAWLQLNNEWLGPTIAFMALIESLVVVGLLVPGVPIMFALGALAGAGAMDPLTMLIWGVVGAAIGDGISFQLGYHYHQKVRYWWPFNKRPEWLKKGEDFFHNHGDLSIALGRFIGPVRPVVPVVAGMLDMPPKRFYIVNILSAIPWAPIYLMPGFLAGAAIQTHGKVPTDFFGLILVLLMLAVLLPALMLWLTTKCLPSKLFGSGASILLIVTGLLVALEFSGGLSAYNLTVAGWLEQLRMPYLQESMAWLTWLGSLTVLSVPALLLAVWSVCKVGRKQVVLWLVAFAGMEASFRSLKWLIDSPRPSVIENLNPFSFPSGHTAQAAFVLMGLAIYLSSHMAYVPRILSLSTGIMLVFLVGLSRLVLHAHWVGDVMMGFTLGILWLFAALYLDARKTPAS
ncbi:bifunctional DedA family/phosphatase PAP2 family protein [Endozoicomonas sp.]|nr:bifunctional DedA family/phosphatase PAP2 family protein [Endozoicomonas sp.]